MKKISIICNQYFDHNLESSYQRAFNSAGYQVSVIEVEKYSTPYIKLGKFGARLHQFLPLEAWDKKTGREIALKLKAIDPDLILITGGTKIHIGVLAFVKSILKAKIMFLWQDPLINWDAGFSEASRFIDFLATFNKATVPVFKRMGFEFVKWIPLAADEFIHKIDHSPQRFEKDLSFVGSWRPERDAYLAKIVHEFPGLDVNIFGIGWENSTNKTLKKSTINKPLFGKEYARTFNHSMINLNVIDDTGYPSANMRFFELFISHSLQLCSSCPDLEDTFINNQHLLYFNNEDTLCEQIEFCLTNKDKLDCIRKEGHSIVNANHLYHHRVQEILHHIQTL